jgi:hypothetical protein
MSFIEFLRKRPILVIAVIVSIIVAIILILNRDKLTSVKSEYSELKIQELVKSIMDKQAG